VVFSRLEKPPPRRLDLDGALPGAPSLLLRSVMLGFLIGKYVAQ
jgi:hypothetical protein